MFRTVKFVIRILRCIERVMTTCEPVLSLPIALCIYKPTVELILPQPEKC